MDKKDFKELDAVGLRDSTPNCQDQRKEDFSDTLSVRWD